MTPDYEAPFGLGNPHLQSVLASNAVRKRLMHWRAREVLDASTAVEIVVEDGVRLQGFYSPAAQSARGLIIFIHGWEGSADSQYVLSAAQTLHTQGFAIFRLNLRDHGDTHHLNEALFHSCRIDEVVAATNWIVNQYPAPARYMVGFSLGGNFALRVAARAPALGIPLDRIFAVCPVLCPANTMSALERGPWIYRFHFLKKWRRSLRAKARAFPHLYDFGDLRRLPTLTTTTDYFVENYTSFANLEDYLNGYAIVDAALAKLELPSHAILARDDPVIPIADIQRLARSTALEVTVTGQGGHCGFLSGPGLGSWVDNYILETIERQA